MTPYFEALSGKIAKQRFELTKPEHRIGRHPDCEIPLDLSSISRFHARVSVADGAVFVEDLQSRNGTFVNQQKIEGKTKLKDGDRIKICEMLFVFRSKELKSEPVPGFTFEDDETSSVVGSVDASFTENETAIAINPKVKLDAILDISKSVNTTLDLKVIFENTLSSLFRIFPQADRGLIILADGSGNLSPSGFKFRKQGEDSLRFSKTIVRQALTEKKGLRSSDAAQDSRFSLSQSITDFRIRSVICAPLLSQENEGLGVIQLDSQSSFQRFTDEDLSLLVGVAFQIASAIENASNHAKALKQEKLDRELSLARDIQQGFLPQQLPAHGGYEFWAHYQAAGQVGGDYYDLIRLPNDRTAVLLGDVSGKGVPAALYMAKVTSDARVSLLLHGDEPARAMNNINRLVCGAGLADKFITLSLCVLDLNQHVMTVVNGGHMSPMIRRADGNIDELCGKAETGLPVGIMDDFEYESVQTPLAVGDSVVIYSDGISEAMNAAEELFTIERLRSVMAAAAGSPAEIGKLVIDDVQRHVAGHAQSDDITLMIFKRTA